MVMAVALAVDAAVAVAVAVDDGRCFSLTGWMSMKN